MARIRSVHPSLFTDEAWVSCSSLARLLYIGLWTDADDQGVFEWKPLQIKMRLLPGDAAATPDLLAELADTGLIAPFETEGRKFGAIKSFQKYQRPKKPNSIHPLPSEWRAYVGIKLGDDGTGSEPDDEERRPVPHQFPTGREIVPQMEDGGGKRDDGNGGGVSAKASANEDWPVDDAVRVLITAVGSPWLDPGKSPGLITTAGRIAAWKRDGASWTNDVIPVVTGLCAGQRNAVSTWKFFDNAIARSIADNRKALAIPEAGAVVPFRGTGPPSLTDRIAAENAEAQRRAFARMDAEHG